MTIAVAAPTSRSRSSSASHARAWLSARSETGSMTVTRVVVHRGWLGSGRQRRARAGVAATAPAPAGARGGAERLASRVQRAEHDHALGLAVVLAAQQVAAVCRTQLPRELQLDEDEQLLGHGCTVSFPRRRTIVPRAADRPGAMSDASNAARACASASAATRRSDSARRCPTCSKTRCSRARSAARSTRARRLHRLRRWRWARSTSPRPPTSNG